MKKKNRMKLLRWTAALAVVAALVALFALQPSTTEAASWHFECPETVDEGDAARVTLRSHPGYEQSSFSRRAATWNGSATEDDYERFGGRLYEANSTEARKGYLKRDIATTEDDLIEGDETFWVGVGDGLNCQITIIDDDFPEVTDVSIVSTPGDGEAYRLGERIDVSVTFDHPVRVPRENRPFARLVLRLGSQGDPGDPDWGHVLVDKPDGRYARYRSGTDSETLKFSYVVQEGDNDPNGISIVTSDETGLGRDLIKTAGEGLEEINALHSFPGQSNVAPHNVSAPRETLFVESISIISDPGEGETYATDDYVKVRVRFSETVYIHGRPRPYMELDFDGVTKQAEFKRVSDGVALFQYRVEVGDSDANGIAISANSIRLNGGSIADPDLNQADLSHDALPPNPGHKVQGAGGL